MAHILVIEDDEVMKDMLIQMLEREGYTVESTSNGTPAERILGQHDISLIITDIVMPEKDGLETIMSVRKSGSSIPVIAVSGGGRIHPDSYLDMASQLGADHLFKKPFDRRDFLNTVAECIDQQEGERG